VKQSLLLVVIAFTCGLIGTALFGQVALIMADEEPTDVVLVLLMLATGLVCLGHWLVDVAEKVHANVSRDK